jgi:hypothetical protein
MVFECSFYKLMEKVGGKKLVDIGSREAGSERDDVACDPIFIP